MDTGGQIPFRALWMLRDPIASRIFLLVVQVRDQKRGAFGSVRYWRSILDWRSVVRWYFVSLLWSVIALCPIVLCAVVANWQVPIAL